MPAADILGNPKVLVTNPQIAVDISCLANNLRYTCGIISVVKNMEKITLSWFMKTLRPYTTQPRRAYQFLLGDFLGAMIGDDRYFVESTSSSRIMNGEYDVPYEAREKFIRLPKEERKGNSDSFFAEFLNGALIDTLIEKIKTAIKDSEVSEAFKKEIGEERNSEVVLSRVSELVMVTDNREKLEKILYQNGNNSLKVISGDIIALSFNKKLATTERISVIPVDSEFTMKVGFEGNRPAISKDTIHGKWLLRMEKLGYDGKRIGRRIRYADSPYVGKIGKTSIGLTEFYLVPLSRLDERGKAVSDKDDVKNVLSAIRDEYDVMGQGRPLYIPLLGTGRSRSGLTLLESIEAMKDAFLSQNRKLNGNVIIVVYSKDSDKIREEI